jgi:hypothetical protein
MVHGRIALSAGFRPNETAPPSFWTLPMAQPAVGVNLGGPAAACADCGFLAVRVNPARLREVVSRFGTPEIRVQDRGVHVTALCPWGAIDSERVRRLLPDRDPAGLLDPEDLAETVVFLAKRSPRDWVRKVIVRATSAVD